MLPKPGEQVRLHDKQPLTGLSDNGTTQLVLYPFQPRTAALAARSIVYLRAAYFGKMITLMFDQGDENQPIVMGVLGGGEAWPAEERPAQFEVDTDGERLIVSAREQLVLRCGKASVTFTKTGKVPIKARTCQAVRPARTGSRAGLCC